MPLSGGTLRIRRGEGWPSRWWRCWSPESKSLEVEEKPAITPGSDKVCLREDRLIVHATEVMDWPIREFSKVPIYFQERRYYVRAKRDAEPPYRVVYELWPWPEDLHEVSAKWVVYDEAYVVERNRAAAKARRKEWLYAILLPVYPVLGLFWSGFKHRVLGPLGFETRSITQASIALIFGLFIAEGIFVGWLAGGILVYLGGWPALRCVDWLVMLLLGADLLVRFSQSLKLDVEHCWGFCEWLWPGRRLTSG